MTNLLRSLGLFLSVFLCFNTVFATNYSSAKRMEFAPGKIFTEHSNSLSNTDKIYVFDQVYLDTSFLLDLGISNYSTSTIKMFSENDSKNIYIELMNLNDNTQELWRSNGTKSGSSKIINFHHYFKTNEDEDVYFTTDFLFKNRIIFIDSNKFIDLYSMNLDGSDVRHEFKINSSILVSSYLIDNVMFFAATKDKVSTELYAFADGFKEPKLIKTSSDYNSLFPVILNGKSYSPLKEEASIKDIDTGWGGLDYSNMKISSNKYIDYNQAFDLGIFTKPFDSPYSMINKCEVLTVMQRVFKWDLDSVPLVSMQYTDVPDWCTKVASFATKRGVIKGQTPTFLGMNSAVSLYEVSLMLLRELELNKISLPRNNLVSNSITNKAPWAKEAVSTLLANEIVVEEDFLNDEFGLMKTKFAIIMLRILDENFKFTNNPV